MKGWMESGRGGKVVLVLVSLLVLGLSAAAWAMKDQEMELTYPANPKAYGKEVVKVSPAPTPGIEVSVVRFEDSRSGKLDKVAEKALREYKLPHPTRLITVRNASA